MAFTQKSPAWADGAAGGTPIVAADLNRMEQGIADANALPLGLIASVGTDTTTPVPTPGTADFSTTTTGYAVMAGSGLFVPTSPLPTLIEMSCGGVNLSATPGAVLNIRILDASNTAVVQHNMTPGTAGDLTGPTLRYLRPANTTGQTYKLAIVTATAITTPGAAVRSFLMTATEV